MGALCAAIVVLWAAVADAHEIGTTRVAVLFHPDKRYQIDIVTDAAALHDKLAALAGAPLNRTLFEEVFLRRVNVAFDGASVRPTVTYSEVQQAGGPTVAAIRLSGAIPADARGFTWTYSWTFASYALTVRSFDSRFPVTTWLDGGETSASFVLGPAAPASQTSKTRWRYFALGFTHILPKGLDHVLFVLGIFLLSGRARSVMWQVSAFTVAHSITLGLSMYNLVTVSPSIVEPLIALSIVYVAIENILVSELKSWRVALVFAFGLLHGLGFAGALKDVGLEPSEFLTALFTFNVGVEAGQLAVIGAAFALVGFRFAARTWYRHRVVIPASLVIGCVAVFWTVQRLLL